MIIRNSDTVGGALSIALGTALVFWLIPDWVEPDPDLRLPVGLVPQIVAIGLILCGAALLIKSVIEASKPLLKSTDYRSAQTHAAEKFEAGELQGLVAMVLVLLLATVGFQQFHFLLVAPVLVVVSMWMFGPIRPLSALLTASVGPILIWYIVTDILGRVLP